MRDRRWALLGVSLATLASIVLATAVSAAPLPGVGALRDGHGDRSIDDICSGGVLEPGKRLQRFVSSLKRGQTGCLRHGSYEGGVDLKKKNITLRNYPGKRATIRGGQVRISPRAVGATIKGLRLVTDQLGPLIYASRAVLADNEITNGHRDICVHIDQYPGTPVPTGGVIQRNRIHDCGVLPANNHDHGIYVAVANHTVIRDNLIYDNADRGVQLWPNADRSLVTGNVIDSNGQGVIFGGTSANNVVEDNIISHSRIRFNVESSDSTGAGNTVRHNCLWAGDGYYGGEPPRSGIQQGHPNFSIANNTIDNPRFADRRHFIPRKSSECAGIGPG